MPEENAPQASQPEEASANPKIVKTELLRKKPDKTLHHADVEEVAEKMHEAVEKPHDGPLEG